jgi:hypothetical protein
MSDRIGNYSLGRVLELELQAELGYRDNIRLDLFQRTDGATAFHHATDAVEQFLEGNGPPPDVLLFELNDFHRRFFRGSKTKAQKLALLRRIEQAASRYDTLVIFFDNSAMEADDVDGLRASSVELHALIDDIQELGFVVLQPSDWLLRELASESPWGNQPWGKAQHHGAPWAIDLTARALASMSYPLIREHLLGREPARLHERGASE